MGKPKTLEEKYKKMSLHEQIIHRPDTYIGSVEETESKMWIYNLNRDENDAKIIFKDIKLIPGLYKIFDEILVNARDHYVRCITEKRKDKCTTIKVDIDQEEGRITVWNNGDGIDVAIHKDEKVWIPAMMFGHLLTSTNYDDNEKKIVGGRNGYGSKLVNIFSKEFKVETVDAKSKKKFTQKWTNNMFDTKGEKVKDLSGTPKPYTEISFIPDFEKFGIDGITDDFFALMKKRTCDIAMTTSVKVYFNGKQVTTNSFQKYIDAYFPENTESMPYEKVFDIGNKRWRVCAIYDPEDRLEHQNISFVNGICTSRGGPHVDMVVDQVVDGLKEAISKKVKKITIKPAMIKENLIFFIDTDIVNPGFDTQTKERMTTKAAKLGSKFIASDAFIKKIIKTGVVDQIIANAQAKAEASLSKTDGTKRNKLNIAKLYDAEKAGTKESNKCYLILTEGDSAKTMALSGMNVVGRKYFGVFPLKGKLLNVREQSPSKLAENEEICHIKQILGLQQGKKYTSTESLRYGHVLIMTDQDVDGSHIKGLFINFIHYFWPELTKIEEFITSLSTPVVKVTKGKEKLVFYSMMEYEEWKKNTPGHDKWRFKYYKGLGTHDTKEAQECFEDIYEKIISYTWIDSFDKVKQSGGDESSKKKTKIISQDEDISSETYKPKSKDPCTDAITLAFDKKRADDRKLWICNYDNDIYLDDAEKSVSYYDFIHKELIAFSYYDIHRSIPNIMDGFKPSQRKIYFACNKANLYGDKKEMKVGQLSGYVSQHSHYHHGEKSLNQTIIGMAQNFVGANNINMLVPKGQFGSRVKGGKDASSERYTFTYLDNITKTIFNEHDTDILKQQFEDGDMIEPSYYVGVVPNVLINGAHGIGTGFSTDVEQCNPREIVDNLKRIINGEKQKSMSPWYRNFTGTVEKAKNADGDIKKNKFVIRAKYEVIDDDKIHITDLPVGVWTDDYKEFLDNICQIGDVQRKDQKKDQKKEKEKKSRSVTDKISKGSKKVKSKKEKSTKVGKVAKKNIIASAIKGYTEDCTDVRVSIIITFYPKTLKSLMHNDSLEKFEKDLKLRVPVSLNNMWLFNEDGAIKKYDSYKEILSNFANVRLDTYQKRKDYLLGKWKKEIDLLTWKMKFIKYVIKGKIIVFKDGKSAKEEEIVSRLEELGFPKMSSDKSDENDDSNDKKKKTYSYLLDMALRRFTQEQIDKLQKMIDDRQSEIDELDSKSPKDIWSEELNKFMEEYDEWDKRETEAYEALFNEKKSKKGSKKGSKRSNKNE